MVAERASLPVDQKILLFSGLKRGDCALFLYGQGIEVHNTFISFIEVGLKNRELCFYAYDNTSDRLHLEGFFKEPVADGRLRLYPMARGSPKEMDGLEDELDGLYSVIRSGKYPALRLVMDFGSLFTPTGADRIIGCVRRVLVKGEEVFRRSWTRPKYKRRTNTTEPFPLRGIIAFSAGSLDGGAIRDLFKLHNQIVISTENEHMISSLNFHSGGSAEDLPPVETLPRQTLARFVKRHFETIVLSMLQRNPMCGYDAIKLIYQRYHTFLSQGTVYPLFYSLQRRGLVKVVDGGSPRSKVYALTEEGGRVARDEIDGFISAQRYLLESIRKV
jgi:DNA-binding PadR family transcriptional regulator